MSSKRSHPEHILHFFRRKILAELKIANRRGGESRELSWTKEFGKYPKSDVVRIEDIILPGELGSSIDFVMQQRGGRAYIRQLKGSKKVTTMIHTHGSGAGVFSYADVFGFLKTVSENKRLRYSVIVAHDHLGNIGGVILLRYGGKIENALAVHDKFKKLFWAWVDQRRHEIDNFPDRFRHIMPGDYVFSLQEHEKFLRLFFRKHQLTQRFIPAKGYQFNPKTLKYESIKQRQKG